MDIRKVMHDPTELATRTLQPVLWLFVFGGAFGRFRVLSTGDVPYQAFLIPGVLAQSMLFISIFFGFRLSGRETWDSCRSCWRCRCQGTCLCSVRRWRRASGSLTQVVFYTDPGAALVRIPLHWGLVNLISGA